MNGTVIAAPIRIGVLGAARIADLAIVGPARVTGHRLVAVAARDRRRAEDFAQRYGVERALGTYADVLADSEVEAPCPSGRGSRPPGTDAWRNGPRDAELGNPAIYLSKPDPAVPDSRARPINPFGGPYPAGAKLRLPARVL